MEKKLFRVFLVACFLGFLVEQVSVDSQQSATKMEKQLSSLEKHEKHETQQAVYFNEEEKKNKEEKQYKEILGGLKYVVEEEKLQFIKMWYHQVFQMQSEREEQGNFQVPEEELDLWRKITKELDQLTSFYLVGETYEYEQDTKKIDYGEGIIKRLKGIISKEDSLKLKELRDEYFSAQQQEKENGTEKLNEDEDEINVEYEIRLLLEPYKQLNVSMIILTLFDDKNMENKAVYEVEDNLDLAYEASKRNGLKKLDANEQLSYQVYWEKVKQLIPAELLNAFDFFKIGSDGESGIYAYVVRLDEKGKNWCLNIDPSDYKDNGDFPYTIVHEISHYLSLNDQQVQYYMEEIPPYPLSRFVEYDCVANKDSYIQKYYEKFWQDLTPIRNSDEESSGFYNRHKKEFVTPYASTSCAEDFAETFCAYILMEKPPTPEVRSKFLFFDQFLEIRNLKAEILKNVTENKILVSPAIN